MKFLKISLWCVKVLMIVFLFQACGGESKSNTSGDDGLLLESPSLKEIERQRLESQTDFPSGNTRQKVDRKNSPVLYDGKPAAEMSQ